MNTSNINMYPKTLKLYDNDAYATEFTANVISCEPITRENELLYKVVLDRTLFFPEEGGQTPDKGTINGIAVVDVQIENGIIYHYLTDMLVDITSISDTVNADTVNSSTMNSDISTAIECSDARTIQPSTPSPVQGKIDWLHRFFNMQQHSAEHIFSGLVSREYHFNNVGFHLSDNIVTMDFDGVLSADQIEALEWKVNQAIAENVEIDARYPEPEELEQMEYRSKKEITEAVRIVTIQGYDACACCAPHVRRTGEIGMFKVMTVQNYKGGVRISFLCGFRALRAFREKNKVISQLTNYLSTGQELVFDRVIQLKESNQEMKLQIGVLKQEAMLGKIEKIPAQQEDVILIEEDLDTAIVRNVVNALVEKHDGICGVFVGNNESGYRFILGSKIIDCRETATRLREKYGAKCGGSQAMIQGSLSVTKEEIMSLFTK